MLRIGPFRCDGSHWISDPDCDHISDDYIDIAENFCVDGVEELFPDLDEAHLYELRLYTQRPKGDDVVDCELQVENVGHGWSNQVKLAFADPEDSSEDAYETPYDRGPTLDLTYYPQVLDEFGAEEPESYIKDRYYAYVRVVDLGPAPNIVEDVDLVEADNETFTIEVRTKYDKVARVTLYNDDLDWEDE